MQSVDDSKKILETAHEGRGVEARVPEPWDGWDDSVRFPPGPAGILRPNKPLSRARRIWRHASVAPPALAELS